MSQPSNITSVNLEWLFSRHRFGMTRSLDTTVHLLKFFGDPQNSAPIIHVAGTNGKGSTCAMLAAIAKQAGFRVGLYTSPHLVDWRERIRIDGEMISQQLAEELISGIRTEAEAKQATFFEITTAIAFKAFQLEQTDLNIIEVGLGGTWDSTNVVHPVVAHLTRVDLDHTEILGKTRIIIARDKTGIWKRGAAATSSRQVPAVERFMIERWKERKALSYRNAASTLKVHVIRDTSVTLEQVGQLVRIETISEEAQSEFAGITTLQLPLIGKHQRENLEGVLCVLLAARSQGLSQFNNKALSEGLPKTDWSSRLEPLTHNPLVLADVAHNPAGAQALCTTLLARKKAIQGRFRLVMGLLADKDIEGVVAALLPLKPIVYAASLTEGRARDGREIAKYFEDAGCESYAFATPTAALQAARDDAEATDCIVLTGSHYLVGALLPNFQENKSI